MKFDIFITTNGLFVTQWIIFQTLFTVAKADPEIVPRASLRSSFNRTTESPPEVEPATGSGMAERGQKKDVNTSVATDRNTANMNSGIISTMKTNSVGITWTDIPNEQGNNQSDIVVEDDPALERGTDTTGTAEVSDSTNKFGQRYTTLGMETTTVFRVVESGNEKTNTETTELTNPKTYQPGLKTTPRITKILAQSGTTVDAFTTIPRADDSTAHSSDSIAQNTSTHALSTNGTMPDTVTVNLIDNEHSSAGILSPRSPKLVFTSETLSETSISDSYSETTHAPSTPPKPLSSEKGVLTVSLNIADHSNETTTPRQIVEALSSATKSSTGTVDSESVNTITVYTTNDFPDNVSDTNISTTQGYGSTLSIPWIIAICTPLVTAILVSVIVCIGITCYKKRQKRYRVTETPLPDEDKPVITGASNITAQEKPFHRLSLRAWRQNLDKDYEDIEELDLESNKRRSFHLTFQGNEPSNTGEEFELPSRECVNGSVNSGQSSPVLGYLDMRKNSTSGLLYPRGSASALCNADSSANNATTFTGDCGYLHPTGYALYRPSSSEKVLNDPGYDIPRRQRSNTGSLSMFQQRRPSAGLVPGYLRSPATLYDRVPSPMGLQRPKPKSRALSPPINRRTLPNGAVYTLVEKPWKTRPNGQTNGAVIDVGHYQFPRSQNGI